MNAALVTGATLKHWRTSRKLSLRDVANLLRINSPSTIDAWEGGQDIPGPSQLLLNLLINGDVPFQDGAEPSAMRSAMLELEMQLGAFEKLYALAMAGGYNNVTDYIASLVQKHLAAEAAEPRTLNLEHRTSKESDLALVSETAAGYVTGSTGAVSGPLQAAAKAFLAENPPADEPPAGGAASPERTGRGRTGTGSPGQGRRDIRVENP